MSFSIRSMVIPSALLLSAAPFISHAFADVVISTAATKNMVLSNGVYSPTANKAALNVNDLTNALNAGNLEVTTGSTFGKKSGDIAVEAALHWVSGNALTFDAFHSIRVDQPVTDAGAGALTLTTNDGGTGGHLEFGAGGNIGFWGLSNALTINGRPYTLVNSIASLAAAITANPSGNFALAASYDAKADHTYKQDPITTTFEGNFEGLGNAISNVSIRVSTGNIGFFNTIDTAASVSDLRLTGVKIFQPNVTGATVGGLAGLNNGILFGDEVSGTIVSHYAQWLGGLIGTGTGSISRCSSTASVTGAHWGPLQGGGGLAGGFGGTISDSFATGDVSGKLLPQAIGGLVGVSSGSISHSHATGKIHAPFGAVWLGGLVGESSGPIADSYATGDLTEALGAATYAGGLVGTTSSSISRSFSTGNLRGHERIDYSGGLVGETTGNASIVNSYATGSMDIETNSAGLLGGVESTGSVSTSYATGRVLNEGSGFACAPVAFTDDYWDTTSSGTAYGMCGNQNVSGITGLTTAQLQSGLPAGFDPTVWAEDKKINHGLPYLIANPPPQ